MEVTICILLSLVVIVALIDNVGCKRSVGPPKMRLLGTF